MLKKFAVLLALVLVAFAVMMATTGQTVFSVERSTVVEAPMDQTWNLLVAFSRWHEWWPGVEEAKVTPHLHPGAQFELVLQGDANAPPATIETLVEYKHLSWIREGVLGSSTRTALQLVPLQEGTEVTLVNTIRGPQAFFVRITGRKDDFVAYQQQVLNSMQRELEADVPQD